VICVLAAGAAFLGGARSADAQFQPVSELAVGEY
jgi:hypothetical protein